MTLNVVLSSQISFPAITIVPAYSVPWSMKSLSWVMAAYYPKYGQKMLDNEATREGFIKFVIFLN